MARRTDPAPADAPIVEEAPAEAPVIESHDSAAEIGLDNGGGGYTYVEAPAGHADRKERRILYNGQNFEHVDTDKDGVWLYRQM